jgi:hypothetical protein
MDEHALSYESTAKMLRVSIHTLRAWMKPPTSRGSINAPDAAVELLCLKLGEPVPEWLDE